MINLSVSPQDLQVILRALGAMPLGEALQTFLNVQNQLQQNTPKAPVPSNGLKLDEVPLDTKQ